MLVVSYDLHSYLPSFRASFVYEGNLRFRDKNNTYLIFKYMRVTLNVSLPLISDIW